MLWNAIRLRSRRGGVGLIGALELEAADGAAAGATGARAGAILQKNGLICRNIGDSIAFCPPMIITAAEIDEMFDIVEASLCELGQTDIERRSSQRTG
jgi:4-aminobutyrate--pyruvate transaminase